MLYPFKVARQKKYFAEREKKLSIVFYGDMNISKIKFFFFGFAGFAGNHGCLTECFYPRIYVF